ncbi:hypothetical protein ACPA9J_11180 [Pseudomonas aeruginosa]
MATSPAFGALGGLVDVAGTLVEADRRADDAHRQLLGFGQLGRVNAAVLDMACDGGGRVGRRVQDLAGAGNQAGRHILELKRRNEEPQAVAKLGMQRVEHDRPPSADTYRRKSSTS